MQTAIEMVAEGKNLTEEEAERAMELMLDGKATQAQAYILQNMETVPFLPKAVPVMY